MIDELLARLDTEADSVKEGSYQHSLCCDASHSIRTLIAGADILQSALENHGQISANGLEETEKKIDQLIEALARANQVIAEKDKEIDSLLEA